MNKKYLYILIVALVLIGNLLYLYSDSPKTDLYAENTYCAFCDHKILDYQKFYEDEYVIGLCTHKPVMPGHVLIIPKRHVPRFEMLSDDEMVYIGRAIKKIDVAISKAYGTSSYLLLQKNGTEVGQTVPHVHFHYMPKKLNENSTLNFIYQFYTASFVNGPISSDEMHETVNKIKEALE